MIIIFNEQKYLPIIMIFNSKLKLFLINPSDLANRRQKKGLGEIPPSPNALI